MTWYLVDGVDGSGKSTVADEMRRHLESQGRRVAVYTHPSTDSLPGRLSARFLTKEGKVATMASTAFYVMDALRSISLMRLNRRKYDDVIFVRYIMAVAYLPDRIYRRLYSDIAVILPMPEVSVFVDVEPEVAMERILARGEELEMFETVEKLAVTRSKMLDLAEDWIIIDNNGTMEETSASISREVFGHEGHRVPRGDIPPGRRIGGGDIRLHLPSLHGDRRFPGHLHMPSRRDHDPEDLRRRVRHIDGRPVDGDPAFRQEGEG